MEDKSWLNKIYIDYQNLVYSVAVSVIKDAQLAEDIVQEVFVTLYYKASDICDKDKIKPWLIKTTVNRAIDFSRRFRKVVILPGEHFEQYQTSSLSDPTKEMDQLYIILYQQRSNLKENYGLRSLLCLLLWF